MRRPLIILPALVALGALGCEDGPTQTYSPAPPGAGNIWNSGKPAELVADAGQAYDAGYPTISKTELCSADFKRERWAWMLTQPIKPPRFYAGLDMANGDEWLGLTITEAETPPATPTSPTGGLCQSNPLGFEGTCPTGIGGCNGSQWGNNGEVTFNWNVATLIVDQMTMSLGYTGKMITNPYPDHNGAVHSYAVGIGDVIRQDGQAFELDWPTVGSNAATNQSITDIFNATMATFAESAGVPFNTATCMDDATCSAVNPAQSCQCAHKPGSTTCEAQGQCGNTDCSSDGNCLVYNTGSGTIFGIRPLVIYVEGPSNVPQPALSTPTGLYNFFYKFEPYSYLPQVLKLDAEGPVAQGIPVGVPAGTTKKCSQKIGLTFGQLTTDCVQVTQDKAIDTVNLNKITHALTHDQEHWTAAVIGVNQNYTSLAVTNGNNCTPGTCPAGDLSVVLDTTQPQPQDVAQDFTFNVFARGDDVNDYSAGPDIYTPGPVVTLAGTELIIMEWVHLMLADVAKILAQNGTIPPGSPPKLIGDPTCVGFNGNVPVYAAPGVDGGAAPGAGCSGLEGIVIPNYPSFFGAGYGGTLPPSFGGSGNYAGDPQIANPLYTDLNPVNNYDYTGNFSTILLKPGTAFAAFCIDPGDPYAGPAYTDCDDGSASMFENALLHVTRVLGGGSLQNLPDELQDRRYYFKWFGIAYIKYLKAFGNYQAAHGTAVSNFPVAGQPGSGLAPSDIQNQGIDYEALFFDYSPGYAFGGAQTFDKFEYVDRDFQGLPTTLQPPGANLIPWDFEYGDDIFGGNQRYDNWYRRMDREEIAMYSAMLVDKTHAPGQENNVNITNLFGSVLLGGNAAQGAFGLWPSWACAVGLDISANDCANQNTGALTYPPLDPAQPNAYLGQPAPVDGGAVACPGNSAPAGGLPSLENGPIPGGCYNPCIQNTDCPLPATQVCVGSTPPASPDAGGGTPGACYDMLLDKNGDQIYPAGATVANYVAPKPILWNYPGVWQQTPFSRGHSPITLTTANQFPDIGVAKISIPNFLSDPASPYTTGPYTVSPIQAPSGGCATLPTIAGKPYTLSSNQVWCNAPTYTGAIGSGTQASAFEPLVPFLVPQPGVGFPIPIDSQHNQWVTTGQFDFTGVLESYIVDYLPYVDVIKPGCSVATDSDGGGVGTCNPGFTCDPTTKNCLTTDNTLQVAAIEGEDFLGQAFLCQDPATSDILHVGMYDSAQSIVDWLAAHPGSNGPDGNTVSSAQAACQILVVRSPNDAYVDYIYSKAYGVTLNIGGGQGQGRVTDIVLWDVDLIASGL